MKIRHSMQPDRHKPPNQYAPPCFSRERLSSTSGDETTAYANLAVMADNLPPRSTLILCATAPTMRPLEPAGVVRPPGERWLVQPTGNPSGRLSHESFSSRTTVSFEVISVMAGRFRRQRGERTCVRAALEPIRATASETSIQLCVGVDGRGIWSAVAILISWTVVADSSAERL